MSRQSLAQSQGERLEAMQRMMEEVLAIQREGGRNEEALERIREIVEESGNLVRDAEDAHEMVMDAQVLAVGSTLVRAHVLAHDTNLTSFIPEDYTSGVLAFVEGNSIQPRYDWDVLSPETCSMFKKVPPISYMLGTFELDPPPPPEKQRAVRQQKKIIDSKKNIVETVEHTEHEGESSDEIYHHILRCLVKQFRRNQQQPVNFLQFITDPKNYWSTVENIFHFAFLVRDGKVKMSLNDVKLPVVEPVLKREKDSERQERHRSQQFNFRISMHEWREIIDTFQITNACITPFQSKD